MNIIIKMRENICLDHIRKCSFTFAMYADGMLKNYKDAGHNSAWKHRPDDGGSRYIRNFGKLPCYTAEQRRRQHLQGSHGRNSFNPCNQKRPGIFTVVDEGIPAICDPYRLHMAFLLF